MLFYKAAFDVTSSFSKVKNKNKSYQINLGFPGKFVLLPTQFVCSINAKLAKLRFLENITFYLRAFNEKKKQSSTN